MCTSAVKLSDQLTLSNITNYFLAHSINTRWHALTDIRILSNTFVRSICCLNAMLLCKLLCLFQTSRSNCYKLHIKTTQHLNLNSNKQLNCQTGTHDVLCPTKSIAASNYSTVTFGKLITNSTTAMQITTNNTVEIITNNLCFQVIQRI